MIPGRFGGIGGFQRREVFGDAGVGVGEEFLEFAGIEVLIPRIDCAELAAVNGQEFAAEQTELAAEQRELPGEGLEGFEVVLAEVGNGFEIGREFAGQPDEFDIALTFRFEAAGGTEAMEVAVKIKLQEHGGIVGRPTGVGTPGPGKAEGGQILFGHEGIEEADGIFRGDIILEPFRKEQRLGTLQADAVFHACQTYRKT